MRSYDHERRSTALHNAALATQNWREVCDGIGAHDLLTPFPVCSDPHSPFPVSSDRRRPSPLLSDSTPTPVCFATCLLVLRSRARGWLGPCVSAWIIAIGTLLTHTCDALCACHTVAAMLQSGLPSVTKAMTPLSPFGQSLMAHMTKGLHDTVHNVARK